MRAIAQLFMYTLILLIITLSKASHDDRHNQNNIHDIKHVQQITGLVITRAVPYAIPQPYQVTVEQEVPYPVKVPIQIPVDRPFEVHIPKPFTVPVIRPVPFPVHRIVPFPVHVPLKHEEHTTPNQEFHHKPLDLEFDVAASLNRPVPVRAPQPTPSPQPVTPYSPLPPPTTPEPAHNQYNYNVIETMRLPLKPAGPMTAVSYQTHRPYSGFSIGAHQFSDYPQLAPAEQNHHHQPQQQQAIIIRRPHGFSPDPAMIGAYQHQPNPDTEHLNGPEPSDLSNEQNHDLLANFAENAVFNLNNRLRRRSSSKADTKKTSTVQTTTTTTAKPPKKT